MGEVRSFPPLVNHGEVDALRMHLAKAARGEAFVLQGGDCAERFVDCRKTAIEAKLKILLQMSLVLTWGADDVNGSGDALARPSVLEWPPLHAPAAPPPHEART